MPDGPTTTAACPLTPTASRRTPALNRPAELSRLDGLTRKYTDKEYEGDVHISNPNMTNQGSYTADMAACAVHGDELNEPSDTSNLLRGAGLAQRAREIAAKHAEEVKRTQEFNGIEETTHRGHGNQGDYNAVESQPQRHASDPTLGQILQVMTGAFTAIATNQEKKTTKLKRAEAAELSKIRTNLTKWEIDDYFRNLQRTANSYEPSIVEIMNMNPDEYYEATHDDRTSAKYLESDAWLLHAISGSLDPTASAVKEMYDDLEEAGRYDSVTQSGYTLLCEVMRQRQFKTAPARNAFKAKLEKEVFFTMGMSHEAAVKKGGEMLAKLRLLPELLAFQGADQEWLAMKMPMQCPQRQRILDEITEHNLQNMSKYARPSSLISIIATHVSGNGSYEANWSSKGEKGKGTKGKGEKGKGEKGKGGRGGGRPKQCIRCGSHRHAHNKDSAWGPIHECTVPCDECKHVGCVGAWAGKAKCCLRAGAPRPSHRNVQSPWGGRVMYSDLVSMQEKWDAKFPGRSNETNTADAGTGTGSEVQHTEQEEVMAFGSFMEEDWITEMNEWDAPPLVARTPPSITEEPSPPTTMDSVASESSAIGKAVAGESSAIGKEATGASDPIVAPDPDSSARFARACVRALVGGGASAHATAPRGVPPIIAYEASPATRKPEPTPIDFTDRLTEAQREALPLVIPQRAYSIMVTAVPTVEDDPTIPQCEIAPHFTSQHLDEERGDAPRLLMAAPPNESAFKAPTPRDQPPSEANKEYEESDYYTAPQSWYDYSAFGMNPPGRSANVAEVRWEAAPHCVRLAATEPRARWSGTCYMLPIMCDSGANVPGMLRNTDTLQFVTGAWVLNETVNAVKQGAACQITGTVTLDAEVGGATLTLEMFTSKHTRRDLIGEGFLRDYYGLICDSDDMVMRRRNGEGGEAIAPLYLWNGLVFFDAWIGSNAAPKEDPRLLFRHEQMQLEPIANLRELRATQLAASCEAHASVAASRTQPRAAATPQLLTPACLEAARWGLGADGLQRFIRASHSASITKVTPTDRELIEGDTIRAKALAKRGAVPNDASPAKRCTRSGYKWHLDGFPNEGHPDLFTGATFQTIAVDEASGVILTYESKGHTMAVAIAFCDEITTYSNVEANETATVFCFDQAPEYANSLRAALAAKGQQLLLAGKDSHVVIAEAMQKPLNNMAMMFMARNKKPATQNTLLTARRHAAYCISRCPKDGEQLSRMHVFRSRSVDLAEEPPMLVWRTLCSVIETESARGVMRGRNAAMGHQVTGYFIGVEGANYRIAKTDADGRYTGTVLRPSPRNTTPIDETIQARVGLAGGAAVVEEETETPSDGVPLLPPPPAPVVKMMAAPPAPPPQVTLSVGALVDVYWLTADGKAGKDERPYRAVCVGSEDMGNGTRQHLLKYDGWAKPLWHDLAALDHPWVRWSKNLTDSPTACDDSTADPPFAHGARRHARATRSAPAPPITREAGAERAHANVHSDRETRAQRRLAARHAPAARIAPVSLYVDECVAATTTDDGAIATWNACIAQFVPDADDELHADSIAQMHARRLTLRMLEVSATEEEAPFDASAGMYEASIADVDYEVNKAARPQRTVQSKDGTLRTIIVPSSVKMRDKQPEADGWKAAELLAWQPLKNAPGTRFHKRKDAVAMGMPIARSVTTRDLKIDKATNELREKNPLKARHATDGAHIKALRARWEAKGRPLPPEGPTSAPQADSMTLKMQVGNSAKERRNSTSADVPDAYAKADRLSDFRVFTDVPDCLPPEERFDEDGNELVCEHGAPSWGEGPSGRAWYVKLDGILVNEAGWSRAEHVPALYYIATESNYANVSTIVDDLFFTERVGRTLTYATIATIERILGVKLKVKETPNEHAGYTVTHLPNGAIMLSMPEYVKEVARKWIPEYFNGSKPAWLLEGKALHDELDRIASLSAEPCTASRADVRDGQSITGAMKWPERCVLPILTLMVHRLSSAAKNAPEGFMAAAKSVLWVMAEYRDIGLVFGGGDLEEREHISGALSTTFKMDKGAPAALENVNDATFGREPPLEVVGILVTYAGAAVHHSTKRMRVRVSSTQEGESIASNKGSEYTIVGIDTARALGDPVEGPAYVWTDNMSNALVGSTFGSATRSRYFLRNYYVLHQRVEEGTLAVGHVADTECPADCLTKWVPKDKLNRSIMYMTNLTAAGIAMPKKKKRPK